MLFLPPSRDHCWWTPDGGSLQTRRGGPYPDLLWPAHHFLSHGRLWGHHHHPLIGCCEGGRWRARYPPHQSAGFSAEAGRDRYRRQPSELLDRAGQGPALPGPVPPLQTPQLPADGSPGLLHHGRTGVVFLDPRPAGYVHFRSQSHMTFTGHSVNRYSAIVICRFQVLWYELHIYLSINTKMS